MKNLAADPDGGVSIHRGDIISARGIQDLVVLEVTETGLDTRIGLIGFTEAQKRFSGQRFSADGERRMASKKTSKAKGKKAAKATTGEGTPRAKNAQGESLSQMVYRMLEAGKDDESIYAAVGKDFPDAAFVEKRYLPWYKLNLRKLQESGKRGGAAKSPKKEKGKKTSKKKSAKK